MKTKMNCRKFRRAWPQSVAGGNQAGRLTEFEAHRASCPACAEYDRGMREALRSVTPSLTPALPEGFDERLRARLRERRMPGQTPRRLVWQLSAAAAVAVAGLFIGLGIGGPAPVRAAERLFHEGQQATGGTGTVLMEMQVRTLPDENFAYIDPRADFVPHTIQIRYGTPDLWRIAKPGRVACCDGERQYMWSPATGSGWIHSLYGNAIEDFGLLLDPRLLLACEEAVAAERTPQVSYHHTTDNGEERVVVTAPAAGVDDALYGRLGYGIDERDNRREYTFETKTGRLIGFRVLVLDAGREVPVVETTRIAYDVPLDEAALVARPAGEGFAWIDLTCLDYSGGLTGMTADEAVRRIAAAFGTWDERVLGKALAYYPLALMKSRYGGAELVAVDKPFRSGTYAGVFVPCRLRLQDGEVVGLRLALRNDNPEKAWVIDGGI